jgi:serine/threonine-protein kinase
VHRDVSPSNVLVNRQGEVKLVDFGIARAESRLYRTLTGVVRGTLPYMAPEQARGGPADRRADVYGAACLVHELFTLQRAFPHGPVPHRAVRVDRLVPGLPGAVGDAVARALAYRQEERTATAQAFADELRTALLPIAPASTEEIAGLVHRLLAATDRQAHESLLVAARLPAEEATRPTAPLPAMRSSDPAASPPDP